MQVGMVAKEFTNVAIGAVFSYPQVREDMNKARRERRSVLWAGAKSAVKNNWMQVAMIGLGNQTLGFLGMQALQMAPTLVNMGGAFIKTRNDSLRISSVPFSQQFEHSDWSLKAQQQGMQAINGANSMIGSEAGEFARRYSRQ
jgi:hypothetical protein